MAQRSEDLTYCQASMPQADKGLLRATCAWISMKKDYCKRGYFRWGKISRKCRQDILRGGNFHDTTHIFFRKAYGFYFRVGVIFAKMTKSRKPRKLPPRENFHVYSTLNSGPWRGGKDTNVHGEKLKTNNHITISPIYLILSSLCTLYDNLFTRLPTVCWCQLSSLSLKMHLNSK